MAGTVTLTDGTFRDEEKFTTVQLTEHIKPRDLDHDGDQDAVVILTDNGGGSGTFVRLRVMIADAGRLGEAATHPLGDRTVIRSLAIKSDTVVVETLRADPMTGWPSRRSACRSGLT